MKVLNISLEKKLFESGSVPQQRVLGYGQLFSRFDLLVLTGRGHQSLDFSNVNIYPTNSFSKLLYLLDAYLIGKKIIKKYKHDIISAQDPFETGFIAWLLAKKCRIKLQIQIHGDYFDSSYWRKESLFNGLKYYLGYFIIKKADSIRVVSNRIKNSLIRLGLAPDKIVVTPIYVEKIRDIKLNLRSLGNKINDKFIFLTVGRLVSVKNISLQIEAMAEVVKKYPQAELWIVGNGPEFNNLKFKIKNLKLEDNIKLFGQKSREELNSIYGEADVFILSSDSEGWGLVVIEAANFGLPIIMTDVGCAGELIKNRESGIIIPVGNKESLQEAMIELIENRDSRERLSKNASAIVSNLPGQEQSWQLYKKSLEKAFE